MVFVEALARGHVVMKASGSRQHAMSLTKVANERTGLARATARRIPPTLGQPGCVRSTPIRVLLTSRPRTRTRCLARITALGKMPLSSLAPDVLACSLATPPASSIPPPFREWPIERLKHELRTPGRRVFEQHAR